MVKSAGKPNKVGEHQILKGSSHEKQEDPEDLDDARTERFPEFGKALDISEALFKKATDS
jgi:hypothetical protein